MSERFQAIWNYAGISIVVVDSDGKIEDANPTFLKAVEQTRTDFDINKICDARILQAELTLSRTVATYTSRDMWFEDLHGRKKNAHVRFIPVGDVTILVILFATSSVVDSVKLAALDAQLEAYKSVVEKMIGSNVSNINIKSDHVGGDKIEGSEVQRNTATNNRVGLAFLILLAAIGAFVWLEVTERIDVFSWF